MESGHVSGTDIGSDLKTHRVGNPSGNSDVSPDNNSRLSPSYPSSSSLSGEVIQLSSARINTSDAGVSTTPLKDKHTEEETPISSMLNSERSSAGGSATLIPPTQAMERSAGDNPSATSNRIPSYVFRTSTTAPTEWSVASNESLFSIQMGTMSFSKDQLNWMSKSGELGYISDPPKSGPFFIEIPSNQTSTRKSTELTKNGNLNEDRFGVTEAAAAETMREVLREKESQHTDNIDKESPRSHSLSRHSDASVKSFAFPILTGDADKWGCTKNKKQLSQPSTPKTTPAQLPSETPKTQTPQETPKPETAMSQTPKASRDVGSRRWFSFFSCFPSCS